MGLSENRMCPNGLSHFFCIQNAITGGLSKPSTAIWFFSGVSLGGDASGRDRWSSRAWKGRKFTGLWRQWVGRKTCKRQCPSLPVRERVQLGFTELQFHGRLYTELLFMGLMFTNVHITGGTTLWPGGWGKAMDEWNFHRWYPKQRKCCGTEMMGYLGKSSKNGGFSTSIVYRRVPSHNFKKAISYG